MMSVLVESSKAEGPWIRVSKSANGHVTWQSKIDGRFHHTFEEVEAKGNKYTAKTPVSAPVQSAATGATSTGKVTATVTQTVSKRSVFDGVLKNARSYGRAGFKGFGWQSLAFQLALNTLVSKGYEWKDEAQDFVRQVPDANYICLQKFGASGDCLKAKDKIVQLLPEVYSNRQYYELKSAMCDRWFAKHPPAELPQGYTLAGAGISGDAQYCLYSGNLGGIWISAGFQVGRKTIDLPIDTDKFAEYAEPVADNAPSDWVGASRKDDGTIPNISKPSVTVPDGTIAQSAPYTNPKTGKAEQVTWTFHTPSGSSTTTVAENITLRPDLQPNSPEAPAVKAPDLPAPDTGTGDGGASTPKPPEAGLCDMYPGILACDEMGDVPEQSFFDDISIPQVTDERTWKPEQFLPEDGVCPAPKKFNVWGKEFAVSYEPLCELMRKIRFAVLIAFILMSAKIIFGGLRSNK